MKKFTILLALLIFLCACGKIESAPASSEAVNISAPETEGDTQEVPISAVDLMPGVQPETSALALYIYDGELISQRYLFETEELRVQVMEPFHQAQATSAQIDVTTLRPPFYGIEMGGGDLGMICGLWSDGYFITKTGQIYEFDYDFEALLSNHPWSEPYIVPNIGIMPCAKYVACTEKGWNTSFMTEAQPLTPPEGIEMQMQLDGTDAKITFTNNTEEEWGYGLDFGLRVLMDDIWYYVPAEQELAFCDILMLLQPGESVEQVYSLASYGELPAGTYRFVTQQLSSEFTVK